MTQKTRIDDLPEFDMAQQLKSKEDIATYVTMVIEDGDSAELAQAQYCRQGSQSVAKNTLPLRRIAPIIIS